MCCNWPIMKGTQRSGICREFYSCLSCIKENAAAWTEGCIIWDATPLKARSIADATLTKVVEGTLPGKSGPSDSNGRR